MLRKSGGARALPHRSPAAYLLDPKHRDLAQDPHDARIDMLKVDYQHHQWQENLDQRQRDEKADQ